MKKYKNIQGEMLDIGSGSGILGLLLKKEFVKIKLNSCEIQDEFIFLSKKNSAINGIDMSMYGGDFTTIEFQKTFDMIVSNPPFYPSTVVQTDNQNIKIARYNDNLPLEIFIKKVSNILKPNGKFFFCYDVKLLNDIILSLKRYNLNIEEIQFLHPKIDKKGSLVMIYARKNSKSLLNIQNPFIMFDGDNFSKKMQDIYNKCNTHSIKVTI
jgi:tRNA1(Val) A37 N6-methylase TrmN6